MRHEDIPDINNPKIKKAVLEGDKLIKEVLNGGYNVPDETELIHHLVPKRFLEDKTER